jgi:methylphosphotriester-DNA--protein-cysteine methyltransferase
LSPLLTSLGERWRNISTAFAARPDALSAPRPARQVHEALQHAEPEESVTSIALSPGFAHMGRFAAEYRKTYGEMPSQTLRKRRPA